MIGHYSCQRGVRIVFKEIIPVSPTLAMTIWYSSCNLEETPQDISWPVERRRTSYCLKRYSTRNLARRIGPIARQWPSSNVANPKT